MAHEWWRARACPCQFLSVANLLKNSAMMLKMVVDGYLEKEAAAGTDLQALAAGTTGE